MKRGKRKVILGMSGIFIVLLLLLFLSGCTGNNLESITGNVVREGDAKSPQPTTPELPLLTTTQCRDSDNGDEPSQAGTTTVVREGSIIVSNDACTGEAELMEHYCVGNEEKVRGYSCKYGCREGRCLTSADQLVPLDEQLQKTEQESQTPVEAPLTKPEQKDVGEKIAQTQEEKEKERVREVQQAQTENYNCYNGFKDSFETDVDCGGPCITKCGYGKMCIESADCTAGLKCNARIRKCMQRAY